MGPPPSLSRVGPCFAAAPHPLRCAALAPRGALSLPATCRWAARGLFAHFPGRPPGGTCRLGLVALAGLPPVSARAARQPGAPLPAPPQAPVSGPRPCAPPVPPYAARSAVFGPGASFPPALCFGAVVVLLRRSGGPSAGPLIPGPVAPGRLRPRRLPPLPPGAAGAALFSVGVGAGVCWGCVRCGGVVLVPRCLGLRGLALARLRSRRSGPVSLRPGALLLRVSAPSPPGDLPSAVPLRGHSWERRVGFFSPFYRTENIFSRVSRPCGKPKIPRPATVFSPL